MSNVPPHSGQAPRFERDGARMGGARGAGARAEAEAYPFTLQQLRNHLERLGYQARAQGVGGEVVREMQARVAELRLLGGLNHDEIASILSVSERTVERKWACARSHLCLALDANRQ